MSSFTVSNYEYPYLFETGICAASCFNPLSFTFKFEIVILFLKKNENFVNHYIINLWLQYKSTDDQFLDGRENQSAPKDPSLLTEGW